MTKTCDICGVEFDAARSDARFCSGKCRTASYRVRRDGEKPKRRRRPITDSYKDKVWDLQKVVNSLDRITSDERFRGAADSGRIGRGQIDMIAAFLEEIRARF
ncbi:hypothetical protein [Agromyces bauzanensis]